MEGSEMDEEPRKFRYRRYLVEPRSYEVRQGPNNRAGWVPQALLHLWAGASVELQPISLDRIVDTQDEANLLALEGARRWIDENG